MSDSASTFDKAIYELAELFIRTGLYSNFKMIEDMTGSYFDNIEIDNAVFVTEFREKRVAIECLRNVEFFAGYEEDLEQMWRPIVQKVMPVCEMLEGHNK